jgi:hypothetical protein
MTTDSQSSPERFASDRTDIDALFRDTPVLLSPHDWAAPGIFESDEEVEEFIAWVRAERNANLA